MRGKTIDLHLFDGFNLIIVQETHSQNSPKSSSIQATVNGHYLSVVFTANMGQVTVMVTDANVTEIDSATCYTPNSVGFYIPNAGSYIVTFNFADGDSYYGEFEITD